MEIWLFSNCSVFDMVSNILVATKSDNLICTVVVEFPVPVKSSYGFIIMESAEDDLICKSNGSKYFC